ncbi:MAG TPA: BatA domain-containing protein [Gemmatimonadaceae bacterium]
MTFLAPGFFFASLAVAAGIVALHFIVTRQPRAGILPTARFVPDMPATATSKATRPSDLLLMLLRVLLVLAAGAGLAKPIFKPSRGAEARVILADISRSVLDSGGVADSVRALYRNHDVLIAFDSSARVVSGDSAQHLRRTNVRGNISAALIAALRAGSDLRERADSVELVIVSPFAGDEIDAATDSIRSLWPGRARLVFVSSTAPSPSSVPLEIRAASGDPLGVAVAQARGNANVRGLIVRSATGVEASSEPVIEWPISDRPRGAVAKPVRDTIGGVTANGALVVAPFERRWSYPADSIRGADVIARWIDGEAAAVEFANGETCNRSVAIPVTAAGDLVIRKDFVQLVAALAGDCVGALALRPADEGQVAKLAGNGGLAPREAFPPRGDVTSTIAPWLIGLAIALAIAELFVRRRRSAEAVSIVSRRSGSEKRAA